MKPFVLTLSFLVGITGISTAQTVADTHHNSSILAIDYGSGQPTLQTSDAAVLFKDAVIDLVSNTAISRGQVMRAGPGAKAFEITQIDPQTSGNAWQIVLQNKSLNLTIYTFLYNVDQNTLSFLNPSSQNYIPVRIAPDNMNNLSNCALYGKFNAPNGQPAQQAAVDADTTSAVDADVTATTQPPALPEATEQPECPTEGYLWQPGFWAFNLANGYYWVPGAWVAPPNPGVLWTPPYWGFVNGVYAFNAGYWGATIGFYGGLNYGFGYAGDGFVGGRWDGGYFHYNTAIMHVNASFRYAYVDRSVVFVGVRNRAAFNGRGGIERMPNERERIAANEHHIMATREQIRNQQIARADRNQFAKVNRGQPATVTRAHVPPPGNDRLANHMPTNTGHPTPTKPNNPTGQRAGSNSSSGVKPPNSAPGSNGTKSNVSSTNKIAATTTTKTKTSLFNKLKTVPAKAKVPVKKSS